MVLICFVCTKVIAGDGSIETEVVNDMLKIRDEIKVYNIASENIGEHREDFVSVIGNELGFDCETVYVSTESIEINIRQEAEVQSVNNVDNLGIIVAKTSIDDLSQVATEVSLVTDNYNDKVYTLPVNDIRDFKSGATISVEQIPIYLGTIQNILDSEVEYPEWDMRKRFKDILIIKDILVDQLGVSNSIASAIIGNICYEGSFSAVEGTKSTPSSYSELEDKLSSDDCGFGIAQWTSKFRQNKLKEYYSIACQDLDWETAAVVAECIYLYNELTASNLLGDMSKECNIEDATGRLGYEYLAYGKRSEEWSYEDGVYKSIDCPRYNYAMKVYHYLISE